MITLLYFPTAMAVLDFGLPRKASNRRATVRSHLETGHRSDVLLVKFNLLSTKNFQRKDAALLAFL